MKRRKWMAWGSVGLVAVAVVLAASSRVTAKDNALLGLRTPDWVLPVDEARDAAKRQGKPLIIVSLNGNLDSNC
jgi:hypothetical protein